MEMVKFNFLVFILIVAIYVSRIESQFKGIFADRRAPDCVQANGRRGKCYLIHECGQFYMAPRFFDVCEFSVEQKFLTLCCDELPAKRYSLTRAEIEWATSARPISPSIIDFECGVRIGNKDILGSISSGETDVNDQGQILVQALTYLAARDGTHPWMASVWFKGNFVCGASLINRRTLLTSAHCFKHSREPADYGVKMGSIYLNLGQQFNVKTLIIHEGYRPPAVYNDIALIVLETQLTFDHRINPVCLASKHINDSLLKAQKPTVIGFGNNKSNYRTLQEVTVPVISSVDCSAIFSQFRKHFPFGLANREFICAGYPQGGKDACLGDSGGPMTIKHYSKIVQIGIVTYGYGCALPDYPGVYTSVAEHYPWIQRNSV